MYRKGISTDSLALKRIVGKSCLKICLVELTWIERTYDIRNFFQWDLVLYDTLRNTQSSVCRHLHGVEMPRRETQCPEFGCPVARWVITKDSLFLFQISSSI